MPRIRKAIERVKKAVSKEPIAKCKHCGKKIHFCEIAKKWFHDHNYMTFCTGTAFGENRVDSPKAEPK
jgi:hypothetical protein